jgi:hypothetical protein
MPRKYRKRLAVAATALAAATLMTGCASDAQRASDNLSTEADQFRIQRLVTFYNGITGEIMLTIQGFCSLEDEGHQLEVTCKVAEDAYTKDFLGLSDNVTYFSSQLETADVSVYHRKFIIKPENLLPEFTIETGRQ